VLEAAQTLFMSALLTKDDRMHVDTGARTHELPDDMADALAMGLFPSSVVAGATVSSTHELPVDMADALAMGPFPSSVAAAATVSSTHELPDDMADALTMGLFPLSVAADCCTRTACSARTASKFSGMARFV